MPKCQWREKPGLDPVCTTLASAGEDYCPRHGFLAKDRENKALEKERKLLVERKIVKAMPKSRREMLEQGYQPTGNGTCRMCHVPIEWWRTPNGSKSPHEPMPELDSPMLSHFATCPFEKQFRRRA